MKILYFGIYNPDYSRNRVLLKGLRANGVQVLECRVEPGFGWLTRLLWAYFSFFIRHSSFNFYDVMVVGFPGQETMLVARLLTGKPVIFDAFTSHYGGYILDRKRASTRSWRAKYYRWLDRVSCRLADSVLLDTNEHVNFFVREFGLDRKKLHRIFVGTDSDVFKPVPAKNGDDFLVHFTGHFIPLQGTEYIIRAAKLLEQRDVVFQLVGRGQEYGNARKLAEELAVKNIRWIDNVPYSKLPDLMAQADVCLGVFGDSPKTPLVIPNKIFEAIAMAKPVITADTPAVRELFADGKDILLSKPADALDLAEKILRLKDDTDLRRTVAEGGYRLFQSQLTENILGRELLDIIKSLRK